MLLLGKPLQVFVFSYPQNDHIRQSTMDSIYTLLLGLKEQLLYMSFDTTQRQKTSGTQCIFIFLMTKNKFFTTPLIIG